MREDSILKLIDFGFAKNLTTHGALHSPCGTPGYSPKELISKGYRKTRTYTMAVDMFSLGCVAYCMLFANPPFIADIDTSDDEAKVAQIDRKVVQGEYEFPESIPLSPEGRNFLEKLLSSQPEERLTASEALKHPWLTGETYQPPRKGDIKTTLTQENSRSWLDQHLQRPIIVFSNREKNREREKQKSPLYRPQSQELSYDSEDEVSGFIYNLHTDGYNHVKNQQYRNLQKKLGSKVQYIDLFFSPYYSDSD